MGRLVLGVPQEGGLRIPDNVLNERPLPINVRVDVVRETLSEVALKFGVCVAGIGVGTEIVAKNDMAAVFAAVLGAHVQVMRRPYSPRTVAGYIRMLACPERLAARHSLDRPGVDIRP